MSSQFTFNDDKLELKSFADRLEQYLMVEHDFVEASLVVALDAPFGAGKSTLLSMWKADLEMRRADTPAIPVVISLNSWEDDFCGDPLLSIATAFVNALPTKGAGPKRFAARIKEAAKDLAWYGAALANNTVANLSGIDVMRAGEVATGKKEQRSTKPPDFVKLYEQRTAALHELRGTLEAAFGGSSPKAIVLVDELDRCRPDFAIHYLETIKHVFNVHGLVFVLAVDYTQLACSAKALFGAELNVSGYFRRFFHRKVGLPELRGEGVKKLAEDYVGRYLSVDGKRESHMDLGRNMQHIVRMIESLKLNPREIQEVFRTIGHINAVVDPEKAGRLYWGLAALTVLLGTLRVADPTTYRILGIGRPLLEEVAKSLCSLFGGKEAMWWFCLYYLGAPEGDQYSMDHAAAVMKQHGWIHEATAEYARNEFRGFGDAFSPYSKNRLAQIHTALESLASFESPVAH